MINMIHGDCMEYMATLQYKAFDLAIVDPPYGIDRYKKNDGGNSKKIRCFGDKDKNWNNEKPSDKYFEELFRISKSQIIWGANNFTLPTSEYFIIWDKGQMMPSFARCEMAWTNCKVPAKIYAYRSQDGDRIHPTQKPVALYKWLLSRYAKPNDKIFDSHVGSGSIRIACHDMGFDFEGCEIDKDYWEAQEDRFNQHISQLSLFTPEELKPEYNQSELF